MLWGSWPTNGRAGRAQVVSTFVGPQKKLSKTNEDTLQYQMMISSQNMPYDAEQVKDQSTVVACRIYLYTYFHGLKFSTISCELGGIPC